jgi:pilus assembly protein CpaE
MTSMPNLQSGDLSPAEYQSPSLAHDLAVRLPPIAVHAFAQTPQTRVAFEQAFADRRMIRTRHVLAAGGFAEATQRYRAEPSPDLIVLESADDREALFAQLDALADVCDPGTKVVLVGAANDIGLFRDLLTRGVSDYLPSPTSPLAVVGAIARLYRAGEAVRLGRTVTCIGSKGGVGASTVAQNLAASLSRIGDGEVILADLDVAFGSVGIDFNLERSQGVAQALQDASRLDGALLERLLEKAGERLRVLAAPADLESESDLNGDALDKLFELARADASYVVFDVPHVWNPWVRRALLTTDEVVVCATPDLVSLRNAKNLIDTLRQIRKNDAPPRLVLNQIGVPKRIEIAPAKFASAVGLEPVCTLSFDPASFSKAASTGRMVADVFPRSAAARSFDQLARALGGRRPSKPRRFDWLRRSGRR